MSDNLMLTQEQLQRDREHCQDVLKGIENLKIKMDEFGLSSGGSMQELNEISDKFQVYMDNHERVEALNVAQHVTMHTLFLQYLTVLKGQIYKETLPDNLSQAVPTSTGLQVRNSDEHSDNNERYNMVETLSESFRGLRGKPQDMHAFDPVFEALDDFRTLQADYAGDMQLDGQNRAFSAFADTYGKLMEALTLQNESLIALVEIQSEQMTMTVDQLMPQVKALQDQTQSTQELLEQNEKIIQQVKPQVDAAMEKVQEAHIKNIRTQTLLEETRKGFGLEPETQRMRVVVDNDHDNVRSIGSASQSVEVDPPEPD